MVNIDLRNTELKFAHDVILNAMIKAKKTKRGAVKKEIFPELVFVDTTGKRVVSRITLSFETLKEMSEMINKNLKVLDKQLKSKNIPKQPKIETKSTADSSYLG